MKTSFFRFTVLLGAVLFSVSPVIADVGGGSGSPVTPYGSDEEIGVEQVSHWRSLARILRIPADNSDLPVYGNGIGLFYRKAGEEQAGEIVEKVPDLPSGIRIPQGFKDILVIDESLGEIILKRPMSQRDCNRIINEIRLQYTLSERPGQGIREVEKAIDRLFLRSHFRKGVFFEFRGTDESGGDVSVDFSVVKSFKIVRRENDRALFEIVVFPDITPEKLVELRPSYTELSRGYTRVVRMWIILKDADRGSLYIAGVVGREPERLLERSGYRDMSDSWFEDNAYFVESQEMADHIKTGREVVLEYNADSVWWAIPSVIRDRDYPLRQYFLIRGLRRRYGKGRSLLAGRSDLHRWNETRVLKRAFQKVFIHTFLPLMR